MPQTPQPILIDGQNTLIYELRLTNLSEKSLNLDKLEVLSENETLALLEEEQLRLALWQAEKGTANDDKLILNQQSKAVIYLELVVNTSPPSYLTHRLHFHERQNGTASQQLFEESIQLKVSNEPPVALGPPLSGGPWVAIHSPAWERGHRRVIYTRDSVDRIPGRFAIDLMKLDEAGKYTPGNEDSIQHWYGYSADVLAVADGTIASAKDSFPESATLSGHPDYSPDQATGNYISLKMGEGQYVFYEHLKPGSMVVKPGERVKKGQVLAQLGFTGQTTGPHLHLHVADADSPLGAEGIPYVLEEFILLGYYPDMRKFGNDRWENDTLGYAQRKRERPGSNTVITFE